MCACVCITDVYVQCTVHRNSFNKIIGVLRVQTNQTNKSCSILNECNFLLLPIPPKLCVLHTRHFIRDHASQGIFSVRFICSTITLSRSVLAYFGQPSEQTEKSLLYCKCSIRVTMLQQALQIQIYKLNFPIEKRVCNGKTLYLFDWFFFAHVKQNNYLWMIKIIRPLIWPRFNYSTYAYELRIISLNRIKSSKVMIATKNTLLIICVRMTLAICFFVIKIKNNKFRFHAHFFWIRWNDFGSNRFSMRAI